MWVTKQSVRNRSTKEEKILLGIIVGTVAFKRLNINYCLHKSAPQVSYQAVLK